MSFVCPLLALLGMGGTVALSFRRRFGQALPVGVLLSCLVMYLLGCVGWLRAGYWLVIAGAAAFVPLLIVRLAQKRGAEARRLLLTPGLVVFVLLYAFVYVLNLNRGYTVWDEFSFWGLAVKETVRTGALHVFPAAGVELHKDYPPLMTIFQSFWCMLCGGYREAYSYRALQTLLLTLFLPFLRSRAGERAWRSLAFALCGAVALLGATLTVKLGSAALYTSIYLDGPVALLMAFALAQPFMDEREDTFTMVRLCAALSCLALTKQMGVGLSALALILYGVDRRLCSRPGAKKRGSLWALLVLLGCWGLWQLVVALQGLHGKFSVGSVDLLALPRVFVNAPGYEAQRSILGKMCRALLENALVTRPLPLSYLQLGAVCTGLFALLGFYARDVWARRRTAALTACVALGGLGYAAAMTLLYMFSFPTDEGLRLISYSRYLGLYWLGALCLAAMLFLRVATLKAEKGKPLLRPALALAAFVWAVCLPGNTALDTFKPALNDWSMTAYCEADAAILNAHTEADARVFIVAERTAGYPIYNIHYQIAPRGVNYEHYSLGAPLNGEDLHTVALTPDEWRAELRDYDYLYLYAVDEGFAAEYGGLFGEAPQSRQLYRIQQADGQLALERVV